MLSRAQRFRSNTLVARLWFARGQTMAEYVLVVVAIAIVVVVAYEVMGQEISSAVTTVNGTILSAAS
jgi:Flp pilus assembly pilin Flp